MDVRISACVQTLILQQRWRRGTEWRNEKACWFYLRLCQEIFFVSQKHPWMGLTGMSKFGNHWLTVSSVVYEQYYPLSLEMYSRCCALLEQDVWFNIGSMSDDLRSESVEVMMLLNASLILVWMFPWLFMCECNHLLFWWRMDSYSSKPWVLKPCFFFPSLSLLANPSLKHLKDIMQPLAWNQICTFVSLHPCS